jgi:hypothetical protein
MDGNNMNQNKTLTFNRHSASMRSIKKNKQIIQQKMDVVNFFKIRKHE